MKRCSHCGRVLPESEFYLKGTRLDSWCKECNRELARERYDRRIADPEFVEKERERGREKYHRLYAGKKTDRAREKSRLYPSLRNGRRMAKKVLPNGLELHHWNYNLPKSLIILPRGLHHRLHAVIKLDLGKGIYTFNGCDLDTIEKHLEVVEFVCRKRGIDFSQVRAI